MIENRVEDYIVRNKLFTKSNKIVIGLSGGADSIALATILDDLGYAYVAAHCNFHLRGEESNRDQRFVEDFAKNNGIELKIKDFDTELHAKKQGISIEMAARDLRYTWFHQLITELKADYIAVAHHRDDSVETVLLNLIRGTGIRGLTGISPKNKHIVRPLLELSRNEIELYLKEKNISYVDDSTNTEDIYTRNKIRLNIIPMMESINPSTRKSIASSSAHLQQVENIYMNYIEESKKTVFNNSKINIELLKQRIEPEAVLYEILAEYGFNSGVVSDIYQGLDAHAGKIYYSHNYEILKDRDFLILREKANIAHADYLINFDTERIDSPIPLLIEELEQNTDFELVKSKKIVYLDKNLLQYPLVLRRWKQGDWFIPFGMKGRKKLSDYFSDEKFSLFDKENTYLLCSGNDIVWVLGHRADDRYKISKNTVKAIKISLI